MRGVLGVLVLLCGAAAGRAEETGATKSRALSVVGLGSVRGGALGIGCAGKLLRRALPGRRRSQRALVLSGAYDEEDMDDIDEEGAPTEQGPLGWPIFACFAYFLSVALTAVAMPSFCNQLANADGSTAVSSAGIDLKGTFESVDQLMTFLFDPVWGAVSDAVGRKPLQLLACSGICVGWGTVAFSRSMPLLIGGRALDGVTSCMLPICQSAVKDVSPSRRLAANLGVLQGVAVGSAFILGGMSGGILSANLPPRDIFKVASVVALVAGTLIGAFGPETLPAPRRAPRVEWGRANALAAIWRLVHSRASGATAAFLLFWLGLNGLQVNMFNYAKYRFGWEPSVAVGLQASSGVVLALSNVLLPKLLLPLVGEAGLVRIGMLSFGACLAAMGATKSGVAFVLAVLGSSVATMCLPGLTGMIATAAPPGEAGATLTALDSVGTLDRLVAYKLMSRLFAWGIGHGQPAAHFYAGAAAVVLGWAVFERMHRANKVGN